MSKLPRFQSGQIIKGSDLNLLMAALDSGGVIDQNSITSSGTTGSGLTSTFPNVTGSTSPSPGSANAPATPTGLSARSGIDNFAQSHTSYVVLTWTPNPVVDFVSRYDIYWHKGADSAYHNITVSGDVNSVRVNDVFPGTTYSFAVQAHDAANRASLWSPELNVTISQDADPPATPTGLAATATTTGVYLTWTEVGAEGISNDLKQYQIAVSLDGGGTYPTVRTVGPGNSYFYTPTTSGQGTVFFKIATLDWTGNVSDYSTAVSAAVGTILGPVTINPGGLTVSTSDLTITAGKLIFGNATSVIVPGATQFLINNNANNANNFILTDAGVATIRAGLTITAGGETITAGSLTITAGNIVMDGANSRIQAGATNFGITNHANTVNNLLITDAGLTTMVNALSIPPSAAGTVATTSYGTVPVKIAEVTPSGVSTFTLGSNPLPTGFRHLMFEWQARSDAVGVNHLLHLRFNNDSGATSYDYEAFISNTSTAMALGENLATAQMQLAYVPGSSATTGYFGVGEAKVIDYNGTVANKHVFTHGGWSENNATTQAARFWFGIGKWRTTATAVTRLDCFLSSGNFITGSVFTLWGLP